MLLQGRSSRLRAGGSFLEEALALIIWFLDVLGNLTTITINKNCCLNKILITIKRIWGQDAVWDVPPAPVHLAMRINSPINWQLQSLFGRSWDLPVFNQGAILWLQASLHCSPARSLLPKADFSIPHFAGIAAGHELQGLFSASSTLAIGALQCEASKSRIDKHNSAKLGRKGYDMILFCRGSWVFMKHLQQRSTKC